MSQVYRSGSMLELSPSGKKRSLVVGVNGSSFLPTLSPLKYPESDARRY